MQGSLFADSTQGPCYSSLLLWGCCSLTLGLRLTPRTPALWEEIPKQVTAFCLMPAVHLLQEVGGPPGLGQRLCQDHLFPVTIWVLVMSTGRGFPGGLVGQDSTCSAGDTGDAGLIPGLGRSPGEGHGNPLQYSCLDNAMDRGAWRATVHGVARSRTQQKPSEHTHIDTWAWDASLDAHKLKQYPLPAGRTAPPAFGLEIPKERTF